MSQQLKKTANSHDGQFNWITIVSKLPKWWLHVSMIVFTQLNLCTINDDGDDNLVPVALLHIPYCKSHGHLLTPKDQLCQTATLLLDLRISLTQPAPPELLLCFS